MNRDRSVLSLILNKWEECKCKQEAEVEVVEVVDLEVVEVEVVEVEVVQVQVVVSMQVEVEAVDVLAAKESQVSRPRPGPQTQQ